VYVMLYACVKGSSLFGRQSFFTTLGSMGFEQDYYFWWVYGVELFVVWGQQSMPFLRGVSETVLHHASHACCPVVLWCAVL
jgi:hypothetical protein